VPKQRAHKHVGVVALNIFLVLILGAVVFVPTTNAQQPPVNDGRYIAIPSTANGLTTGAVYILDTIKRELVAVAWNQNKNRIMSLGYRNLLRDAETVPQN
jgi:hypothetical protein